jgi:hypothetical protein
VHFIEHFIEPQRLLLTWIPPEGQGERYRRVVGELYRQPDGDAHLRYLTHTADFGKAIEQSFTGHPAFDIEQERHTHGVMQAFMRRLPPPSRDDYSAYLEGFCIGPGACLSDFTLLGYTGARLPSDGFGLVHPFDGVEGPCEFLTDVAGVRYFLKADEAQRLPLDAEVTLQTMPENPRDPNAVGVLYQGRQFGHIKRGLTETFRGWLRQDRVHATIERLNGNPRRPMVFLFVRVLPAKIPSLA